jgi:hypothetical protein
MASRSDWLADRWVGLKIFFPLPLLDIADYQESGF